MNNSDLFKLVFKKCSEGKATEALTILESVLEKNPSDAKLLDHIVALLQSQGEELKSIPFLMRSIEQKPAALFIVSKDPSIKVLSLVAGIRRMPAIEKPGLMYNRIVQNNLLECFSEGMMSAICLSVEIRKLDKNYRERFPRPDVIYVNIPDPEHSEESLSIASKIIEDLKLPFINEPSKIANCSRYRLHRRFYNDPKIYVPKITEVCPGESVLPILLDYIKTSKSKAAIVRLAGHCGGEATHVIDKEDPVLIGDLMLKSEKTGRKILISEYVDVSTNFEGFDRPVFSKYRAVFADGVLYPIHLFYSTERIVNYKSYGLTDEIKKVGSERFQQYLSDPSSVVGLDNWNAINKMMEEIGLDYCGVDFSIKDGKVVVFEANPAMLNTLHLKDSNPLSVEKWKIITERMEELFVRRARGEK